MKMVLRNVNLRVPAGTSLAIVGPTGSGKSTLVSLIPRIYEATAGSVLIDGRPIREFPLEVLRANIGFVPQETFLFSDSIRDNIAFGAQDATDDDVRRAAEAASIAADIEGFPEGYNTLVGERGLTLSGGQKQRTAIARALIRNPRILVLDDALASVDTQTEDRILNHLREIMRGRTTIFISHRVSTVRNADRIAVLHHGKIVEYGTHDELIALNGYYTELLQQTVAGRRAGDGLAHYESRAATCARILRAFRTARAHFARADGRSVGAIAIDCSCRCRRTRRLWRGVDEAGRNTRLGQ